MKLIFESTFDGKNLQGITNYLDKDLQDKVKITPKQLERITEIIRVSNYNNLVRGQTYKGTPVAPLKQSTIDRKGHARVFYNTGELFQSVSKRVYFGEGQVFISSNRSQIASWLFEGRKDMKARQFFGISQEALNSIDKVLAETR